MICQAGVWPLMRTAGYTLTSPSLLSYGCVHSVHATWRDSAWAWHCPGNDLVPFQGIWTLLTSQIFGNGIMTAGIQMRAAEGTFQHLGAKNGKTEHLKKMKGRPKNRDKLNCFPEVISLFFPLDYLCCFQQHNAFTLWDNTVMQEDKGCKTGEATASLLHFRPSSWNNLWQWNMWQHEVCVHCIQ